MQPTILVADDDESIRDLLHVLLSGAGYHTLTVEDGRAAVDMAVESKPDIALLDVMMPVLDGFEACRAIKADPRTSDIPVLLLTALAHTNAKVQGLDCGASDYVTKPFDTEELLARLRTALVEKHRRDALATEALTDALTGLTNRRGLEQQLDQLLAHVERTGETLSLLMFDADHFKAVNDTYGHDVGDVVLTTLAQRARETVRTQDVVGRFGGEEFLAILPSAGHEAAYTAAERLRAHIAARPVAASDTLVNVTVSVGVATKYSGMELERAALLAAADRALYAAKRGGRNRVIHADRQPTAPLMPPEPPEVARALVAALGLADAGAIEHARSVSQLCWHIGSALRLSPTERAQVAWGGLLHDVGRMSAAGSFASADGADGRPDPARYRYARAGAELLHTLPSLDHVADLVGAQEERWNGSGYPKGLRGDEIPLGSRIIAVADAYDRLRRHGETSSNAHGRVEDTLQRDAGTLFDPTIVAAALRVGR